MKISKGLNRTIMRAISDGLYEWERIMDQCRVMRMHGKTNEEIDEYVKVAGRGAHYRDAYVKIEVRRAIEAYRKPKEAAK